LAFFVIRVGNRRPQAGSIRASSLGALVRLQELGSNLGPKAAELGPKPCTTTQNKAKQTSKIESVQERIEGNQEQIAALRSKVESPPFRAAVRLAMEETWRTDEAKKIKRFAAILGNSVAPNDELDVSEDVSDFIRAVAQLSERDIQALQILYSVFADVVKVYPNLHDPNVFTERAGQLLKKVDESKIHRDDFYSYCKRLEGFGLAIEVPRNTSRMAPGDYCFRPTRRGLKLLSLLEEFGNAQQTAAAV
jgi:hypothetical protein